jgi:hypothetical protein
MVTGEKMKDLMELLTEDVRDQIPELTSQEDLDDPVVYARFYVPSSNRAWFAVEGESVLDKNGCEIDFEFFGRIHDREVYWGSWTLNDLLDVKDTSGSVDVKRDPNFAPKPISEIGNAANGV